MSQIRRDDELFDEIRLRRALRLETAELPPRLDPVAIVARAESQHRPFALAALISALVAVTASAFLVGLIAVALPTLAPAFASELWTAGLSRLAQVAVPVTELLGLAQQPVVPMSAIAALAVAIAFEYTQRRERSRAVTT